MQRKESQRYVTKLCRLLDVFWNERRCFGQDTCGRDQDAVSVYITVGTEHGGVGGKKGYIYWSSGNILVQLVSFVG
jgi:hypothetical protein